MTKFEKRFFKSLGTITEAIADRDREAFEGELEDGTNPGDFDLNVDVDETVVDDDPNVKAAVAVSERNAAMKATLEGWVGQIDEFLQYLNGAEPDSIQTILASAEADTIFDRMKASEQRKIARVATELAALNESFKGYLAQTGNAQFKYV